MALFQLRVQRSLDNTSTWLQAEGTNALEAEKALLEGLRDGSIQGVWSAPATEDWQPMAEGEDFFVQAAYPMDDTAEPIPSQTDGSQFMSPHAKELLEKAQAEATRLSELEAKAPELLTADEATELKTLQGLATQGDATPTL